MPDAFSRTTMLLGRDAMQKLARSTVAVYGLGGVGSYAAEALARCGLGGFVLVDDDCVCLTNINRQVIATRKTVGRPKVEVMAERVLEINPQARVTAFREFYNAESAAHLLPPGLDYVIDAVDTISSKLDLIQRAQASAIPVISAMGAGNKLDPTRLEVADIYKTSICPLARVMRKELRRRGVRSLKVVYSRELPLPVADADNPCRNERICPNKDRTCLARRQIPGSVSFVTAAVGLIIAAEVVKDLIAKPGNPG